MRYLAPLALLLALSVSAIAPAEPIEDPVELAVEAATLGKDTYEAVCVGCHAPSNIMVSSPKLHRAADWVPRLEKGFDAVLDHAVNGVNAMPAMGTCSDCTLEAIAAAIRYMAAPALGLELLPGE